MFFSTHPKSLVRKHVLGLRKHVCKIQFSGKFMLTKITFQQSLLNGVKNSRCNRTVGTWNRVLLPSHAQRLMSLESRVKSIFLHNFLRTLCSAKAEKPWLFLDDFVKLLMDHPDIPNKCGTNRTLIHHAFSNVLLELGVDMEVYQSDGIARAVTPYGIVLIQPFTSFAKHQSVEESRKKSRQILEEHTEEQVNFNFLDKQHNQRSVYRGNETV